MKKMNTINGFKVGFSKEAIKALKRAGITNDEAIELEEIVCNYPKAVFDIDSFDGLFYGNVQLTWIRNWIEGTAAIITHEEAKKLDAVA